jgi:hypothetical protein
LSRRQVHTSEKCGGRPSGKEGASIDRFHCGILPRDYGSKVGQISAA